MIAAKGVRISLWIAYEQSQEDNVKKWLTPFVLVLFAASALAQSESKLGAAEKRKLDTFFSNFSEVNMQSFKKDSLSDKALLDFALMHHYKNNFKSLKRSSDGASVIVPAERVDQATLKYFGRKIGKHAKEFYAVPLADGEAVVFSQIGRLVNLGNDLYQAEGVIYSTGSGSTLDQHGTPAEWKKKGEEVDRVGTFTAVIKADSERYILVEYTVKGAEAAGTSPEKAPVDQAIPIQILGKTMEIRSGMTRSDAKAALSSIISEDASVDTAERLQYDVQLVPEEAPVSIVFDFDKKGVVSKVMLDAQLKAQNPPVVKLVDWLQKNAGKPVTAKKGNSTWTFSGYKIEHVSGGSGEDSVYGITLTRSK